MLDINKQKMKYSLQGDKVPVYETDDEGNIKYYTDDEGNKIPFDTGSYETSYSEPIEFRANIAFSGGEAQEQVYGFDASDYDGVIIADNNEFPLEKGSLIWLSSEVGYKESGSVDDTTADFTIVGIKPSLSYTKYMLKAKVK